MDSKSLQSQEDIMATSTDIVKYAAGRHGKRQSSDEWKTPRALFDVLDEEFMFSLDACATNDNALVSDFISPGQDALKTPWSLSKMGIDEATWSVWCNPPYSQIGTFVQRAYDQSQEHHITCVVLIPTYTDPKYWRDYCSKAHEIRHLVGRLQFLDELGQKRQSARFPSSVVIFKWLAGRQYGYAPHTFSWDWRS